MTTAKQLAALKPHQYPKGTSGNPAQQFPKPRSWYLKRYGIEYEGRKHLSSELAKMFGITSRQVRNRVRSGTLGIRTGTQAQVAAL